METGLICEGGGGIGEGTGYQVLGTRSWARLAGQLVQLLGSVSSSLAQKPNAT